MSSFRRRKRTSRNWLRLRARDVYKRQEYCGVQGRVDIITGTLGKALGGASGGYTSGRKEIIDLLRQRSRPYLFSNSLAPAIAGASIELFDMLDESTELRDHLEEVTAYYLSLIHILPW